MSFTGHSVKVLGYCEGRQQSQRTHMPCPVRMALRAPAYCATIYTVITCDPGTFGNLPRQNTLAQLLPRAVIASHPREESATAVLFVIFVKARSSAFCCGQEFNLHARFPNRKNINMSAPQSAHAYQHWTVVGPHACDDGLLCAKRDTTRRHVSTLNSAQRQMPMRK